MANPFGLDERRMLNDPRSTYYPFIVLERDGDHICAHLNDFVNLQESPPGFGKTVREAVKDFLSQYGRRCHKALWWGTGMPAGTCDEPAYTDEIHPNSLAMILCKDIGRCPKHGGFALDAAAALVAYYRVEERNREEAHDWEEAIAKAETGVEA